MLEHGLTLLSSLGCHESDKLCEFSKHFVFFIAIWTFPEEVLVDWQHLSQFKDDSNFTMLTSHLHSLTHSIPSWLAFSLTWHYKRLPVKQCKQYLNVTTINSSALQEGAFNGCFLFKGCTGDEYWKLDCSWWGIWLLCLLFCLFVFCLFAVGFGFVFHT